MDSKQNYQNGFRRMALVFGASFSISVPVFGQQTTSVTQQKWRPKDGVYAGVGKNFNRQCDELGDVIVEFNDRAIVGHEWNCKIDKVVDTAPDAIRLNMTCDDYNLAESLRDPNPEERRFKEIMTLRRIDEKSVLAQKTLDGKSKGPAGRVAYCPADTQRSYLEGKERDKREAARKAADDPKVKK